MEVKKQKEEDKIEKQLAVNKEDAATEVLVLIPVKKDAFVCVVVSHSRLFGRRQH